MIFCCFDTYVKKNTSLHRVINRAYEAVLGPKSPLRDEGMEALRLQEEDDTTVSANVIT